MSLPLFFYEADLISGTDVALPEEGARHIVQVLRMQPGESLRLTDGKGAEATTVISSTAKKKCNVLIQQVVHHPLPTPTFNLAVAFTKNTSRNEWLLEKATELGVRSIIPILAHRSEREKIRYDRWRGILTSALLQSQQYHLPELHEATPFSQILQRFNSIPQKLLAHCMEEIPRLSLADSLKRSQDTLLLIGPEGDFTPDEVEEATAAGFQGISLGWRRLRTETAAMAACAYFSMTNS